MDAEEFYKLALDPNFPDEMLFNLKAANPVEGKTFSRGGITGTVDQIDSFIMARIFGQWKKTGRAPHEMQVKVSIEWTNQSANELLQGDLAFYDADLTTTLSQVDGQRRIPRTLDQSPENR